MEFLANIVRLYRGEGPGDEDCSRVLMKEHFPRGKYADVPGLCKDATINEIEAQGWSLNPGRYVGVAEREKTTSISRNASPVLMPSWRS